MSQETIEIVREGYDAYSHGDLEAFGELLAPDATLTPGPEWTDAQVRHGPEEIRALLAEIRAPLDRNEAFAERVVEGKDCVVAEHVWRGVIKGTEDEVEGRIGVQITVRAGKLASIRFFNTRADALKAAGLSE